MKCFIFAAGMGIRMGVLSKPLLNIGGETVVGRLIRQCSKYWTNDIIVGVGYKAEEVKRECLSSNALVSFVENKKYETTGMLKTLLYARKELEGEKVFYVLHGDAVMSDNIFKELPECLNGMTVVGKVYHPFNDSGIISFMGDQFDILDKEISSRPTMSDDTFAILSRQYGWELYRFQVENGFFFNINSWDAYNYIRNWRMKHED